MDHRDNTDGVEKLHAMDAPKPIGIKVDGMTDTEVTAAVDAALATPKPVLPSGIYTTIPDATQIVDLVAALFAEIEKECEDA